MKSKPEKPVEDVVEAVAPAAEEAVEHAVETAAPVVEAAVVEEAKKVLPGPVVDAAEATANELAPRSWAALKAWIRTELDLHAAGVDHNERELQNP